MNVSLTPELERLVGEKVKSGMYQTASEVVREALRVLQHRDEELRRLRSDIQAGLDQIGRGRFPEYDRTSSRKLAAEVKTRGRGLLRQTKRTGSR